MIKQNTRGGRKGEAQDEATIVKSCKWRKLYTVPIYELKEHTMRDIDASLGSLLFMLSIGCDHIALLLTRLRPD